MKTSISSVVSATVPPTTSFLAHSSHEQLRDKEKPVGRWRAQRIRNRMKPNRDTAGRSTVDMGSPSSHSARFKKPEERFKIRARLPSDNLRHHALSFVPPLVEQLDSIELYLSPLS